MKVSFLTRSRKISDNAYYLAILTFFLLAERTYRPSLILMKAHISCIALVITLFGFAEVKGGGGSTNFETQGQLLLSQAPALAEALNSQFKIRERGLFGPGDAPFVERKLYTYMDFRATSVEDEKEAYLIRIHFDRMEDGLSFRRLEIFPLPSSVSIDCDTFRELYDAMEAIDS